MTAFRPFSLVLLGLVFTGLPGLARAQEAPPIQDQKNTVPYHIITNDVLIVSVYGEEDLSAKTRVDAKGEIRCNLLSDPLRVYGLTLGAAERKIEDAYRDGQFLLHPKVHLTVESYAKREVSITGQVKSQGRYELPIETATTVADIILHAGGFTDTAKGTEVMLTRKQPDGTSRVYILNIQSVFRAKKNKDRSAQDNMQVEPDDYIYVPQKLI